jgi:damage-control phosphatase, subfamily I
MRTIHLDPICQDCFAEAVEKLAVMHELSAEAGAAMVAETRALVGGASTEVSPPEVARLLRPLLIRHLGVDDPFAAVKQAANAHAGEMADELRARIEAAPDPFAAAVRVALAGNVIDFAYQGDQNLLKMIDQLEHATLGIDHTELLRAELAAAKTVLYLGDNTGEVWCDRLLIERFPTGPATTFATREVPVLNDATLIEAREAGLHELTTLISSGSDAPGALPKLLNERTRTLLAEADVVVSKGQGNFEALFGRAGRPVFFLFLVKCSHVESVVGHPVGTGIVWRCSPA